MLRWLGSWFQGDAASSALSTPQPPGESRYQTVSWPLSGDVFSRGGVPFCFMGQLSRDNTLDGVLVVNNDKVEGNQFRFEPPDVGEVLSHMEVDALPRSREFPEVEVGMLFVYGVSARSNLDAERERVVGREIENMLFCVRKYALLRCGSAQDMAVALRMVMDELFPFLDERARENFIAWFCARAPLQHMAFVLRKPVFRPLPLRDASL